MPGWRPLRISDIAAVSAIAARVHPGFFEEDAVFADRLTLSPDGCWLLEGERAPLGYVLAHPWRLGSVPALDTVLGTLPEAADTFYLHDLALLPGARGTGAAGRIVRKLIEGAKDYPTMSLVAVNGSQPFWSRFGFVPHEDAALGAKLASYDAQACYMVRRSAPLANGPASL